MIQATVNGINLPPIEQQFLSTPIENATDVVTLSGETFTDFTSQGRAWTFNYDSLTKEQYDAIRSLYDAQFTDYQYPELSIPFYSVVSQPCRMTINTMDIWNHCGDVQNVKFTFRETDQLPEVS